METIYSFEFLRSLFNEMAGSYDRVNTLTSFGFSNRFRQQFIEKAALEEGLVVCDLMCGAGESWAFIVNKIGATGKIIALDLSPMMIDGAKKKLTQFPYVDIRVMEGNALSTGLPDDSVDRIVIGFGLKTLATELLPNFSNELFRILRPNGLVSMIEMSEPRGWRLRPLFMWYLKKVVPVIGRLLLGNPSNYRMLGIYTERFQGCEPVAQVMQSAGFESEVVKYFFGCATGIVARKPIR